MAGTRSYALHAVGTTTNANSPSVNIEQDVEAVALEVNVEAVGATPTATFELQGSMDGNNWYTVRHVPSDSEVAASTAIYTTVGRRLHFLKTDLGQVYRFFRAVSSANTNVTFSSTLHVIDQD